MVSMQWETRNALFKEVSMILPQNPQISSDVADHKKLISWDEILIFNWSI